MLAISVFFGWGMRLVLIEPSPVVIHFTSGANQLVIRLRDGIPSVGFWEHVLIDPQNIDACW
jgi:hypothetical protein